MIGKKRMTITELRTMLHAVADKNGRYVESIKGDDNPQVVAMRIAAEARAEVAKAALLAMGGDRVLLGIMGR